mmetsp:Transcript_8232/g.23455  ORF Transcript_8232/g.23455 Transcript_8232/m.23455 type:complete len:321 (+) Transcript_8232:2716-3678(+)
MPQGLGGRRRSDAAPVDLLLVLPPTRRVGRRKVGEAVLHGVRRRLLHAHVKAHGAPRTALGLELHALGAVVPLAHVVVVVRVHEGDAELLSVALVLVLADHVLLLRVDVRVVEEDGHVDALGVHLLDHGPAARCAAAVEQHLHLASVLLPVLVLGPEHGVSQPADHELVTRAGGSGSGGSVAASGIDEEACVAVGQEAVFLVYGVLVDAAESLRPANESAHEQHQRRVCLMEVSDERVADLKIVAWRDAERRCAHEAAALCVCLRGQCPQTLRRGYLRPSRGKLRGELIGFPLPQSQASGLCIGSDECLHAKPMQALEAA